MKQFAVIYAVLCCVLLSACGGGGGGGGISVVPPGGENPALTEPERTELRGLAARAAAEIMEPPPLPKNLEAQFMAEIAGLQSAISSSQSTKAELQRQIDNLRNRVETEKTKISESPCEISGQIRNSSGVCEYPPCGAGEERINGDCVAECLPEQVRNNGVCEYLPCGAGKERISGVCVAECLPEQVRDNGVCEYPPCGAGKERIGGVCVAECLPEQVRNNSGVCEYPPCGAGKERIGGVCVAECLLEQVRNSGVCEYLPCGAGMERINGTCQCSGATPRREGNQCLSPLTVADCNNEDKILENNECRSCTGSTPRREGNQCLSPLTVADCNNEDKILENNACRSCTGATPRRDGNRCLSPLTVAECNNEDKILENNACRSCTGATPRRDGNRCLSLLTVADCNNEDKILENNACRSCTGATPRRVDNVCMKARFTCDDGSVHDDQKECEFRTAEYGRNSAELNRIGAIYAYQRGYHGQSVTVVNSERVLASHEDLAENVLTMSISVQYKGFVNDPADSRNRAPYEKTQRIIEYLERYNGDRFDENRVKYLVEELGRDPESINGRDFHGTGSAGVIAAARNGLGGHGVAPQAKIIPIPIPDVLFGRSPEIVSDIQYILDKKIPIINNSFAFGYVPGAGFKYYEAYGLAKDSDSVFVWSSGNIQSPHNLAYPGNQLLPHHIPDLEDNWLIAAGWTSRNNLFGRTCGDGHMWCIAAPVTYPAVPDGSNKGDYRGFNATSTSAPIVSGALAVLKSAAPNLPMTVIRSILLTTATDLGEPGIDDVFGWGGVNISAGIALIENMQTPPMRQMSPVSYRALRGGLPAEFAHMKARFSAVEIAVNLTNDLYYNMPLSRMFSVAPGRVSPPLGDAALKLLSSPPVAEENPPSGFFAFGDIDGEIGVRWRGKTGAFGFLPSGANMLAEASHVVSDGALSGASFGALGTASGSSNGGKFRLGGRLLGGLSAFGEYEYRDISAGVSGALLDSRIRGAEASGWSAGLEYGFIGGGRMRISASRRTELSGGELVLRYPKAVGADLGDAFLGRGGQVLMEEEAALPLSRHVPLLWSLGYVVSGSGKSEWSAALEYDEGADNGAISAAWRLEF